MSAEAALTFNIHDTLPIVKVLNSHSNLSDISLIIVSFIISEICIVSDRKDAIFFRYLWPLQMDIVKSMLSYQYHRVAKFLEPNTNGYTPATQLKIFKSTCKYTIHVSANCSIKTTTGNQEEKVIFAIPQDHILVQIIGAQERTWFITHNEQIQLYFEKIHASQRLHRVYARDDQLCYRVFAGHQQSFVQSLIQG